MPIAAFWLGIIAAFGVGLVAGFFLFCTRTKPKRDSITWNIILDHASIKLPIGSLVHIHDNMPEFQVFSHSIECSNDTGHLIVLTTELTANIYAEDLDL